MTSRKESFCFAILLGLIVWLPIPLGSNRPWAWSIFQVIMALQTILLVYEYRRGLPWERLKSLLPLLLPLVLFQIYTAFQLIPLPISLIELLSPKAASFYQTVGEGYYPLSLDPGQTQVMLWLGICYCLLCLNVGILVTSRHRLYSVMIAIVVSGTLQGFYASMLALGEAGASPVFGFPTGSGANGSFVYRNHLANYLMLCLSIGVGVIVARLSVSDKSFHTSVSERISSVASMLLSDKMLVRMSLVIMVIALIMTRSRMGNTAFMLTTIVCTGLALFLYKRKPRSLLILIISILVIDALLIGAIFGVEKVKERLDSTVLATEARPEIVEWSMLAIQDFTWFGSGAGSFYSVFPAYHQHSISSFFDHAHNEYIEFIMQSGVIATGLLAFAVLYCLGSTIQTIRIRNSGLMKGTALGCMMAIFGMCVHILVDFNLHPAANAALFVVILTLSCIAGSMPRDGYKPKHPVYHVL